MSSGSDMPQRSIAVIDYGMGNIRSVVGAVTRLHEHVVVTSDIEVLRASAGLILPGVGAFGAAMKSLSALQEGLTRLVVEEKKPILGICLGMQLLANDSDEHGFHQGLGWIRAHVRKMNLSDNLSLPHVGWNQVASDVMLENMMFKNVPKNSNFYFDHSYHFIPAEDVPTAQTEYGISIKCAIVKDNIWGVQFHPEKSQINGLRVIKNFLRSINAQEVLP